MALRPQTRLSLWVICLGAAAFAAFIGLLQLPVLSIPLLIALSAAYLLDPLLDWIESRGHSRNYATGVLTMFFLALSSIALLYLPDWLGAQVHAFAANWDAVMQRIHEGIAVVERQLRTAAPFLGPIDLENRWAHVAEQAQKTALASLPGILVQAILGLVMLPLLTFFLIRDGRVAKRALLELVPNHHFEMTLNILWRINRQVGAYLRGVILEAVLVGATAFVALFVGAAATGIGNALPLSGMVLIAGVVGVTNLIPYIGPLAGGITGLAYVLFTLPDGGLLTTGLSVVVFAVVVTQLADNGMIGPLVIGRAVDVHPVIVVLLLLVFGRTFGLLGLVVAVPVWAVACVLFSETRSALRNYGRHVVERAHT